MRGFRIANLYMSARTVQRRYYSGENRYEAINGGAYVYAYSMLVLSQFMLLLMRIASAFSYAFGATATTTNQEGLTIPAYTMGDGTSYPTTLIHPEHLFIWLPIVLFLSITIMLACWSYRQEWAMNVGHLPTKLGRLSARMYFNARWYILFLIFIFAPHIATLITNVLV
jgi:hypothetical protein